jgi:hypothetical protein
LLFAQEYRLNTGALVHLPAVSVWSDFDACHRQRFCVFYNVSIYVHLNLRESSNGQGSERGCHKPTGVRHNGKLCPTEKREAIINGLAAGKSKRAIARECKASHSTVDAIEQKEWAQVSARKQMLAAKHERTAVLALDELLHRLETRPGEIPTPVLNIIGGTSTDKALALRGDSLGTIRHIHSIDISDEDIVAFAVARSQRRSKKHAKAAVVEVAALPAETHCQGKKTPRKKPV